MLLMRKIEERIGALYIQQNLEDFATYISDRKL